MTRTVGVKRSFTDEDIREIRRLYKEGRFVKRIYQDGKTTSEEWIHEKSTQRQIADMYQVTVAAINHILTGRTYKRVK